MVWDSCSVMRGGSRVDRRHMGMRRRMLVSRVRRGQRRRKTKRHGDDCRCQNPGEVVLEAHDSRIPPAGPVREAYSRIVTKLRLGNLSAGGKSEIRSSAPSVSSTRCSTSPRSKPDHAKLVTLADGKNASALVTTAHK